MTCVCGHPHEAHVTTTMSVPIEREPGTVSAYAVIGGVYSSVSYRNPTATYERDECHCGCCKFEKFEEDDV